MLTLRTIELSDRDWVNEALRKSDFMGCEYSFANNLAWRRLNDTQITQWNGFYLSCSWFDGQPVFTYPAGQGDLGALIEEMKQYAEGKGFPLIVSSVGKEQLALLEERYPGQFAVEADEDSFDYIYLSQDLRELKGKKYHQKRNHLAKFYQNDWIFEPITPDNMEECIEFSVRFYNDKGGYDDRSAVSEQFAINTFFNHFEELNLTGGVLRIEGRLVAFTIGEKINSNTFCVHIEKADAGIQGAYAAINHQFAQYAMEDCKYINREEDLGLEGLRRAKRSYYPVFQLEKNTVTFERG